MEKSWLAVVIKESKLSVTQDTSLLTAISFSGAKKEKFWERFQNAPVSFHLPLFLLLKKLREMTF